MTSQLPSSGFVLRHGEEPKLLAHYTDQVGLFGILQSKEFWATDIRFLNDQKEFDHGLGVAREELAAFLADEDEPQRMVLENADRLLDRITHEAFVSKQPVSRVH